MMQHYRLLFNPLCLRTLQKIHGNEETRKQVEQEMPRRVKKRRPIQTADGSEAGWQEYYDYIWPTDQGAIKLMLVICNINRDVLLRAQPTQPASNCSSLQSDGRRPRKRPTRRSRSRNRPTMEHQLTRRRRRWNLCKAMTRRKMSTLILTWTKTAAVPPTAAAVTMMNRQKRRHDLIRSSRLLLHASTVRCFTTSQRSLLFYICYCSYCAQSLIKQSMPIGNYCGK